MISIIVPVYNAAPYLPQCLDSLVNQTYRDIEIICVNDGSTDNSLDILKAYAERDSRILVIHQENQGLSDARNKGLKNARGEWVMFVDSDDWIDISTCQITLETVHAHQADVVMWTYNREYEGHSLPKYYITSLQTWDANNIRVQKRGDSDWEERSRLQLRAARNCNRLLALIGIAKSSFHLKSKRVKYWVGKVLKIRGMIRNWNESDSERYAVKQRK